MLSKGSKYERYGLKLGDLGSKELTRAQKGRGSLGFKMFEAQKGLKGLRD